MKGARETLGQSVDADSVLAELVEEITKTIQSGEPVDWETYERDYPEQMEQLRGDLIRCGLEPKPLQEGTLKP